MGTLTIKDIARICNVSTSTVSRAMNEESGINKATKARILKVIEEYNFVPNNSARNLKMIESNTIALLIKGINNQFFQSMISTFETELNKLEYSFIIHTVGENQDEIAVAAELIKEKKLKGIIFLGGRLNNTEEILKPIGIPYVRCTGATDATSNAWGGSSITIDDCLESMKAVEYLINCGHRRIAILPSSAEDHSVGRLRLEGYKQALKKHGIEIDPELIRYPVYPDNAYTAENGYLVTKELIESKVPCTAIYAVSDTMAFGVYKAILEAGKEIPKDYSVIGFDGISLGKYYHPALTTIMQPCEEMIIASIRELMKAINGEEFKESIFFEGTLVERDSVRKIN